MHDWIATIADSTYTHKYDRTAANDPRPTNAEAYMQQLILPLFSVDTRARCGPVVVIVLRRAVTPNISLYQLTRFTLDIDL